MGDTDPTEAPPLPAEETIFTEATEAAAAVEAVTIEEAPAPAPAPAPVPAPAPAPASSGGGNKAWQERAKLKNQDNGGAASSMGTVKLDSSRGGLGYNDPNFGVRKKAGFEAAKATGRALPITEECETLWNRVLDNDDPLTFVVLKYDDRGKELSLKTSGTGGLAAFVAELEEDKVCWGGFRCWAVDDRGNVTCERAKFVFVQWMPQGASTMRKAKMGPHKGSVKEVIHSVHLDVQAEDKLAFGEDELVKSLQAATGAHKPNGYRFEEGKVVSADYYKTASESYKKGGE